MGESESNPGIPETLKALVDRLPHGVTLWRADTDDPADLRIIYANPQSCLESGVDHIGQVGRTVRQRFPAALEAPPERNIPAAWQRVATSGVAEVMAAVPYGDADHPTGVFRIHLIPLPDRVVANVYENVTERLRTDAARRHHEEALARSNQALEQFAYALSHDLQTPLRTIAGFVELLAADLGPSLTAEQQEMMHFVVDASGQMKRQINGLLAFARLGRDAASREPVELGAVVDGVLGVLREPIRTTGAVVEVGRLPTVPAVRAQMFQLLQNLVENAIKYRRPEVPLRICIAAARSDGAWRVDVADNGRGVPEPLRPRAFRIFTRLDGGAEPTASMGLGLAMCRRIVELHGGTIGLADGIDGGVAAWFTLPTAPRTEEASS